MFLSTDIALSTTPELICRGRGGDHRVYIHAAAAGAFIGGPGGPGAQTFPVDDSNVIGAVVFRPILGEEIWAVAASGTPTISILESGLDKSPSL